MLESITHYIERGLRVSILACLVSLVSFAQTQVFPPLASADKQLKVAVNRLQTQLSSSMLSTDTSISVVNGTGFVANMVVGIDSEFISICNVSGNTLTVGHNSCPSLDGRGFDNTTAAAHTANLSTNCVASPSGQGCVSNFFNAWYHNGLRVETESIENYLVNHLVSSDSYNFTPQQPNQTLTGSVLATIALSPVPTGVITGDTLIISGGTGTAEVVTITLSGSNAIFTPVNNHSGAWTLQSATSGIQEAVNNLSVGRVVLPFGTTNIYKTITIKNKQVGLWGQGADNSTLAPQYTSGDVISLTVPGGGTVFPDFGGFYTSSGSPMVSGYILDLVNTGGHISDGTITGLSWSNAYNGIYYKGDGRTQILNVTSLGTASAGITVANGSPMIANTYISGLSANAVGFYLIGGAGTYIVNSGAQQGGYSILIDNTTANVNEVQVSNFVSDSYTACGICIQGTGSTEGVNLTNIRFGQANAATAFSIILSKNVQDVVINGMTGSSHTGIMMIGVQNVAITNSIIPGDGTSGSLAVSINDANQNGTGTPSNNISITNSIIGYAQNGSTTFSGNTPTTNAADTGISVNSNGAAGMTGVLVKDCLVYGHTTAFDTSHQTIGTDIWVANNGRQPISTISSAASLVIPFFSDFLISGSTGATSISGPSLSSIGAGRKGTFRCTSSVVFTASGGIGNAGTCASGKLYQWQWDGTSFWITGSGF